MDDKNIRDSDPLREILRPLAGDPEGDHPDIEELLHFQLGELNAKRRQRITEHVALCVQCTEALADLADFPDVDLGTEAKVVQDADVQDLWQAVEEQISDSADAVQAPMSVAHSAPQEPAPTWAPWNSLPWLRAASIVLMASSFTFGSLWWQGQGSATSTPVLTSETLILRLVDDDVQRDGVEASRLSNAVTDLVHLSFPVPATLPFDTFEAVFFDAQGQPVLETGTFSKHQHLVAVAMRRDAVPPGRTLIALYGLTDGSRVPVGTYALDRLEDDTP